MWLAFFSEAVTVFLFYPPITYTIVKQFSFSSVLGFYMLTHCGFYGFYITLRNFTFTLKIFAITYKKIYISVVHFPVINKDMNCKGPGILDFETPFEFAILST